ncbi:MAG: hypothetical protein V1778_02350 [bacterium]
MKYDVQHFATHRNQHPDEQLSRALLEWLAEGRFGPGKHAPTIAPDATFVAWQQGEFRTPDGRGVEEWIDEGTLPLGTGGAGPFNDHQVDSRCGAVPYCDICKKEPPRWCTSDIIAFDFGLVGDMRIRALLRYVHANDVHGIHDGSFDWAKMLFLEQQQNGRGEEAVYQDWKRLVLEPTFVNQTTFLDVEGTYRRLARRGFVQRGDNVHRFVSLRGDGADHPRIADYARNYRGGKQELVFRRQSSGNVQILVAPSSPLRKLMAAVAAVLRYREFRMNPANAAIMPTYEQLAVDGDCSIVPHVFYYAPSGSILNGSDTHPDVKPMVMPYGEIVELTTKLALPLAEELASRWGEIDPLIASVLEPITASEVHA